MSSLATGSLVSLGGSGGARTYVFVHGAGGSAAPFVPLASQLSKHGVCSAFDATPQPVVDASLTKLAQRYVHELERQETVSPILVGWSMGATVAFEMARLLRDSSTPVPLVIAIDGSSDWLEPYPREVKLGAAFVDDVLRSQGLPALVADEVTRLSEMRSAAVAAFLCDRLGAPQSIAADLLKRFETFSALGRLHSDYVPAVSKQRMLLISTASRARDQEATWRTLSDGATAQRVIQGDHFSLLREPWVGEVARTIAAATGVVTENLAAAH